MHEGLTMETVKAAQITCTVYRPVARKALDTLRRIGVKEYHQQSSRAVVLKRKAGFLGIGAGIGLEEELADRFLFYVPVTDGAPAVRALSAACDLNIPGRGTALWEDVDVVSGSAWEASPVIPDAGSDHVRTQANLACITCIVQHGRGNNIVKAVLGLGLPMPLVTTGDGTGIRDKMGLIRIALPARKDVVFVVASAHEVAEILDALADAGRIDRVGAGFIYESPVAGGVVNNMVIRGQRHSASIEQIIAAVDDLQGSADWRKRALGGDGTERVRHHLRDLVNLTLICNEGRAEDLVRAAMVAGAGGATISKLHYLRMDQTLGPVSPARQVTELIVGVGAVEPIVEALKTEGVFEPASAGFISLKPVDRACTHQSTRR